MAGYDFKHLGDILREGIYEVPDYQRNYAWEERQWEDLWKDLEHTSIESESKHYIGTIVVEKRGDSTKLGKTFRTFKIIDGQQRLATLVILLFCIHEELKVLPLADATKTADNILGDYIKDESAEVYRIKLNGSDDDFLKDIILRPHTDEMVGRRPRTPSERRLREAKMFFSSKLSGKTFDYLNQLIEKICSKLLFIRYEVGSEVEAGLVFEVMNDRGKDLTQVDKIKNYLIYLAYKKDDPDLAVYINEAWGEIFKNVMEAHRFDEDDLLRYHWIIYTGQLKESDIHRRLKERLDLVTSDLPSKIRDYTGSLKEASYVFRELNNPDVSFSDWHDGYVDEIRDYLNGLHRLRNIATFMPLLMASRIVFKDSPQRFSEIVRACESFAFRVYKVCNRRADTGLSTFHARAHQLFRAKGRSGTEIQKAWQQAVGDIHWYFDYYGDKWEFELDLNRASFYEWLETYEIQYLFYELAKKKCKDSGEASPQWSELRKATIEHIWPQIPRGYNGWSDDQRKQHVKCRNKLGNLTLTFWNPELSNKDFSEKRDQYSQSDLVIQRELAKAASWGEEEIEARTQEIVKFALERWKRLP